MPPAPLRLKVQESACLCVNSFRFRFTYPSLVNVKRTLFDEENQHRGWSQYLCHPVDWIWNININIIPDYDLWCDLLYLTLTDTTHWHMIIRFRDENGIFGTISKSFMNPNLFRQVHYQHALLLCLCSWLGLLCSRCVTRLGLMLPVWKPCILDHWEKHGEGGNLCISNHEVWNSKNIDSISVKVTWLQSVTRGCLSCLSVYPLQSLLTTVVGDDASTPTFRVCASQYPGKHMKKLAFSSLDFHNFKFFKVDQVVRFPF